MSVILILLLTMPRKRRDRLSGLLAGESITPEVVAFDSAAGPANAARSSQLDRLTRNSTGNAEWFALGTINVFRLEAFGRGECSRPATPDLNFL
jgi:hypothetical protein